MQFFYFLFIVSVFYMGCEEGGEGGGWGGGGVQKLFMEVTLETLFGRYQIN